MNLKNCIPALVLAAAGAQAASPVETYGALAVNGNKLVDSAGSPVALRGMSLFLHNHPGGREFWNSSALRTTLTDWHASVIRAPIAVDNLPWGGATLAGALQEPENALQSIRRVVDAAIELGLYVVVDWHTEQIHAAEAKAFFGELAREYGSTPNIIWEIYNEPNGPSWSQIADYAKQVIPEIRKSSSNVILVGNPSWDMHPEEPNTELDGFPNIAYTVHFSSEHTHWTAIDSAMDKSHAVFASEWTMAGTSGEGNFQDVGGGNIKSWIDAMEAKGVSYVNWSLGNPMSLAGAGPGSSTFAALNPGVSQTGPWADADLTPSGLAIRAHLRSRNPAWSVSDTTTRIASALAITSDKKTDFTLNGDSIRFGATYSKSVAWTLTETARTSGAKLTTTGSGSSVFLTHLVGKRNAIPTTSFALGDTVDVVLQPTGQTLSYTISSTPGITTVLRRVKETRMSWSGSRLALPSDLLRAGTEVRVVLRDASGKTLYQSAAQVGLGGLVELAQPRPRTPEVQILEVRADDILLRARLSPMF